MRWRRTIGTLMTVAVLAAGCSEAMTAKKSLYDRLAGTPAIQAVVGDFIGNVAADGRINRRFAGADIPRLKTRLVDQICEAVVAPASTPGRA